MPRKKQVLPVSERRFLTLNQAAAKYGPSRWTFRDWALAGKIESRKIGKLVVIPEDEIERLMEKRPRLEAA